MQPWLQRTWEEERTCLGREEGEGRERGEKAEREGGKEAGQRGDEGERKRSNQLSNKQPALKPTDKGRTCLK